MVYPPKWAGGDLRLGRIAGISGPGIAHSHQHTHFHITVEDGLARETHLSYEVPHVQHYPLCLGHLLRLALQLQSGHSLLLSGATPGLSGCHTLKVPANVRARARTVHARVGSPEVLTGHLRGTLPYHQGAGPRENIG